MRQKYTIVMNTANRQDDISYLQTTVQNLANANVFSSFLFGGFFIFHTDKPFSHNTQQNALRALEKGYENNTEWVIFLEDDVDFISDFLESVDNWLSEFYKPEVLFYPFGAAYQEVHDTSKKCWEYPPELFYGCQAYAIHKSQLEKLILFFREANEAQLFMHDMLLRQWALSEKSSFLLTPCPSFIQHIGIFSSIHSGRFFEYGSWPGKQYKYNK